MKVTRLRITPLKGTELHAPDSIELNERGVALDRRFYLIDRSGLLFNGKKEGRLVQVRAEYDAVSERLVLRIPGRSDVAGVWSAGEPVTTNFYGRPVAGRLALGPWSQALSEFVGRPVRLVAVDRLGDAVDVHPVTLVSSASIERLRASDPGAAVLDYRRFRMLIEFDGLHAHGEDEWYGGKLKIGSAVVSVFGPVPRCVVTSQDPQTGERDFDTLKAIRAYRGMIAADPSTPTAHLPDGAIAFGVYGLVVTPGRVAVGDGVMKA